MRDHLYICLYSDPIGEKMPYWADDLSFSAGRCIPFDSVDEVLSTSGYQYKTTMEYPMASSSWTEDEKACGMNRIYRLVLTRAGRIPQSLIENIRLLPEVEQVRSCSIGITDSLELSTKRGKGRGRVGLAHGQEEVGLTEAQLHSKGDRRIRIAILDTGVDCDHNELAHAITGGSDFVNIIRNTKSFIGDITGFDTEPEDEVGHGTHVAGIIAARGKAMSIGIVPDCTIIPVRVLAAMRSPGGKVVGAGLVDNINVALKWAIDQGVDVINMSLGVKHSVGSTSEGRRYTRGLPHEEVVKYAIRKGVTIVAASGNSGSNEVYYPSGHPWVLTCGAVDETGEPASFSTFGRHVDVMAPGTSIYSSSMHNGYAFSTGTSHAAPFLTGAIALLKSYALKRGRKLSDQKVKHLLKHSCDRFGRTIKDPKSGFGSLNIKDSMRLLKSKIG